LSRPTKTAAIGSAVAATALAVIMTAPPAMAFTEGPFTATLNGTMTIDAGIAASCTESTLSGTIDSEGALTITSATVGGCGVPTTAENLPWSGTLKDGVATFTGFQMSAIGCTYRGDLTGSYTGTDFPTTATFTDQSISKISGFLCPSPVEVSAKWDITQP
jgi:hypothetical protein